MTAFVSALFSFFAAFGMHPAGAAGGIINIAPSPDGAAGGIINTTPRLRDSAAAGGIIN